MKKAGEVFAALIIFIALFNMFAPAIIGAIVLIYVVPFIYKNRNSIHRGFLFVYRGTLSIFSSEIRERYEHEREEEERKKREEERKEEERKRNLEEQRVKNRDADTQSEPYTYQIGKHANRTLAGPSQQRYQKYHRI
jgi:hypothetical protein